MILPVSYLNPSSKNKTKQLDYKQEDHCNNISSNINTHKSQFSLTDNWDVRWRLLETESAMWCERFKFLAPISFTGISLAMK